MNADKRSASESPEQLIARLNEQPDPSHGDLTPAVHALVAHGLAALPHLWPALDAEDRLTRLRAQRVLEGVTLAWVRQRVHARPLTRADTRAWQALWRENGSYDWRAPAQLRRHAVRCWQAWTVRARR